MADALGSRMVDFLKEAVGRVRAIHGAPEPLRLTPPANRVNGSHGPRLAAMPDHQPGGRHVAERAFQAATGGIRDMDPLAGLQAAGVQQLVQG